jgi:hypothetical protein
MWLETDFSEEARKAEIATPFLVIGDRQDLPGFQEDHLRKTFGHWYPNVEFAFIADAGHYPMHEYTGLSGDPRGRIHRPAPLNLGEARPRPLVLAGGTHRLPRRRTGYDVGRRSAFADALRDGITRVAAA